MTVDPTASFQDIHDKLASISSIPVFESEMPEDKSLQYDAKGVMKPFYVIYYGGPIRGGSGRSLVSTRRDSYIIYATIESVSARAKDARAMKGKVIDKMLGYIPYDCTELQIRTSSAYSKGANDLRPTQYIETVTFVCYSNTILESV